MYISSCCKISSLLVAFDSLRVEVPADVLFTHVIEGDAFSRCHIHGLLHRCFVADEGILGVEVLLDWESGNSSTVVQCYTCLYDAPSSYGLVEEISSTCIETPTETDTF